MKNQQILQSVLEKISYHVVYDVNIHEAIDYAAKNGFSGIQVAVEVPRFSPERYSLASRQSIQAHAKNAGIRIALHAPDATTSLFASHPALKRGIRDYYADLFAFAKQIGTSLVTIHLGELTRFAMHQNPGTVPLTYEDITFYEMLLKKNLEWLCLKCPAGIELCVENYALNEFILNILTTLLQQSRLFLCWDIAKTYDKNLAPNQALEQFLIEHLKFVRQCHLHDIVPGFHAHQVIGSGSLHFPDFLIRLQRAPVADYCIEVRPREKALESLHNLKKILLNYDEQMQRWQNLAIAEPDDEIKSINQLESELARQNLLDEKVQLIRQQISFLEPTHFRFFENLYWLCENIGQLNIEHPVFVCMTINETRRKEIENYLKCLKAWLDPSETELQNSGQFIKINALLEAPSELKRLLVERLILRIEFLLTRTITYEQRQFHNFTTDRFGGLDDADNLQVRKLQENIIELSPHAHYFEQHICENYICHHKFLRHLEIIVENIGRERWNLQRRSKNRDGYVRAVQTQNFIAALDSWLQSETVDDEKFAEISHALGERNPVREWLVCSLKKTLTQMTRMMQDVNEPEG